MTIKERITYLIEQIKELHDEPKVICGDDICDIIECLEKQIPKKPLREGHHFECPNKCGTWILFDDEIPNDNDNYCSRCGQAIDWSEE